MNQIPISGCQGCGSTGGRMSCHIHGNVEKLQFLTMQWEYPHYSGHSTNINEIQYAYFLNEKGEVIKKEIKQPQT